MRVVRRNQTRTIPWTNGRGIAHQVIAHPASAGMEGFVWRISLGEGLEDYAIAPFMGVDRSLLLMEGRGVMIDFGGGTITLDQSAPPVAFPGEAPATGWLIDGPSVLMNVMTRRGMALQWVEVIDVMDTASLPPRCLAVVCRDGQINLGSETLYPCDTALLPAGQPAPPLGGRGQIVAVRVEVLDSTAVLDDDPTGPADRGLQINAPLSR